MFVEKMQFSVSMATGYEGLPLTATQAEQEEAEAFTVKAGAEQEEAKAEEASFVVKAGCGSKTKEEEDREEEAAFTVKGAKAEEEAAFTVQAKAEEEAEFTVQAKAEEEVEDSDDDCDSDEEADLDHEEFMARLIADYDAHAEKLRADNPWLTYTDYDTEEYAYMRRNPEEVEDSDDESDEKLRIYNELLRKLGGEGSNGADGLDAV